MNKRQEKKLQDSIATSASMTPPATDSSSIDDDPSTQKENRATAGRPSSSSSSAHHLRSRAGRGGSKGKGVELTLKGVDGGVSTKARYDGSGAPGAASKGRGPLRGLGNARQQQQEAVVLDKKKAVLDKEGGVLARVGRVDEETPPECVQS